MASAILALSQKQSLVFSLNVLTIEHAVLFLQLVKLKTMFYNRHRTVWPGASSVMGWKCCRLCSWHACVSMHACIASMHLSAYILYIVLQFIHIGINGIIIYSIAYSLIFTAYILCEYW